jgi:hypothetical protein
MKSSLSILFLIICQFSFSQEKLLHGKIYADGNNVEGINIVNLVNEKSTVSDGNGDFYILAKAEDLLVFSAINFEYKRKIISDYDLNAKVVEIKMIPKVGQLDEVVITEYKNINAVSLGILATPAKVYTPAERKVRTATTGLIDPLLNLISGRTKMLKKNVQTERKAMLLDKIEDSYEDAYFIEKLKIPLAYVKGFKYYAVENSELVKAITAKNRTLSDLLFVQLSEKYKVLLSDEKK